MKNPIKWLLRKLIEYALTERSSTTIWLGWADVSFGGKRAIQLGVPVDPTDALRYQHVTKVPTEHLLIDAYEKVYEDLVERSGTNTDWLIVHDVAITSLYMHCVRFWVTLRTAGATAEATLYRFYQATTDVSADTELLSTTSTTYVGFSIRFDNLRFAPSEGSTFRVSFRTTDSAYPWYSDRTTIWTTHARPMK